MPTIAVRYDLRSPDFAATKHPDLYATCLEQAAWADERGLDIISLSEHHGVADGFMPAPLTMAAAIAARTSKIMVTIAASLVPLHDPVRMAEQFATVDLIARGRVSMVIGLGYAEHEFQMAGIDRSTRAGLAEEYVEVMRRAWTGEPFEWQGREIVVTPRPYTQPHPPMFVGGSVPAAAKRAARLRLWFFPAVGDPKLKEVYDQACIDEGFDGGFCLLPSGPGFVHVTEDPDKAWAEIERYAWYDADTYRSWQTGPQRSQVATKAATPKDLRAEGIYAVVTPDECVKLASEVDNIVLHPLLCGMPVELGWSSLELFVEKVLPRIRPA